jgi:NADPH:quinone reductase-like Zn-dependent oxidoreductase
MVLVHGAAGRVGTAVLELGSVAGLRMYGTCSARDRAAVERLGAVAIDYRNEDFLARIRALPERGVYVVLDGLGGKMSLRSFRALRPGGRLVIYGHSSTISHGHRSWRGWIEWYAATATVGLWGLLALRRRVFAYRIQKLREGHQVLPVGSRRPLPVGEAPATRNGSARTSSCYSSCSVVARSTRSWPSACPSQMRAARTNCSSSPCPLEN